ncbi:unnamed protein product [Auanema sp. JU1783]|nr:unnamed protein product [Auanema sp. JU1783]
MQLVSDGVPSLTSARVARKWEWISFGGSKEKLSQSALRMILLLENGDEADDTDSSSIEAILDHCSNIVEAKYLLQHLFSHSLEQGVLAANVKANNRELEAKVQHLEQQSFINEQLLSTVIEDKSLASDLESLENGMRRKSRSPSLQSMRAGSTSPSITDQSEPTLQLYKARRRTATTDEMLYPSPDSPTLPPSEKEKQTFEEKQNPEEERKERKRVDVPAFLPPSASATHPPSFARNTRLRSTYGGTSNSGRPPAAPSRGGRDVSAQSRGLSRMSSYSRLAAVAETIEEPSTSIGAAASVTSLPSSSSTKERSSTRDQRSVFARLIPSWSQEASPKTLINRKQGRIVSVRNDSSTRTRVVTRTHTLEGHSKAILACATTEDHLLTGSKDRTAKLWDLSTGQEIRTLGVHPNSVHSVKFVPNSNLALSISMYQVRVWDIRTDSCIRVLHSSGQIIEGDGGPVGSRQNTVPFLETVINSAEVDPYGRLLFTSFAGDVRIWNLEKWASFGRLVGASHSPRSEVSCLAVATGEDDAPFVFTGSRDHYVKMYEVNPAGEGVHEAAVEFSPPHYDNVTCTLAYKGNLFTASKDYNIMKFSLTDYKRDHLELKSHDGYVQGMCMVGINSNKPLLASVCREGTIKFWDVASSRRMKLVEEISKAHSGGINGICCNNYLMFTASSDQTVGFWKINADS